jgi:hypothetical protein
MPPRARLILTFWACCSLLAACAKSHDEIAPLPVDPAAYADLTCPQLGQVHAKAMRDLLLSEVVQDGYYRADRTRTFGVPTPMATLFGDSRAEEVARLKGDARHQPRALQKGLVNHDANPF